MTPLEKDLIARIEAGGPMPFAAFMSLALYHPVHGYYAAGPERSGWRGHFLTSPELDPAFGALWARGFEQIWKLCGHPDRFVVVEVGPGEGAFCRALLDSADGEFADALRVVLVERMAALTARQLQRLDDERVSWVGSLDEAPTVEHGCVFANEVLDNLPVHVVEKRAGRVMEMCVDVSDGRLVTTLLPPSSDHLGLYLERCSVDLEEGHRFEVGLAAESFVARAGGLLERGAVIFVDYGATAVELAVRPHGTLVSYSTDGVDDRVLAGPGTKDITAHTNWTSVTAALEAAGLLVVGPMAQRDVLRGLGLNELDTDLKRVHAEATARGAGAEAVRALSRRQALGALSDPGGLGRLEVIAGLRGIEPPGFLRTSRS